MNKHTRLDRDLFHPLTSRRTRERDRRIGKYILTAFIAIVLAIIAIALVYPAHAEPGGLVYYDTWQRGTVTPVQDPRAPVFAEDLNGQAELILKPKRSIPIVVEDGSIKDVIAEEPLTPGEKTKPGPVITIPRDSRDFDHPWLKPPKSTWKYQRPKVAKEDIQRGHVIVQRGWTLSGVAQAVWGNSKLYPRLQTYNDMGDSTLIRVGQGLWLRPKIILTDEERLKVAREAVRTRMLKVFHWRTRKKDYPRDADRIWAQAPLKLIDPSTDRLTMKMIFTETIHRVEWVDVNAIYETMIAEAKTPEELIMLASVSDEESDNTMLIGAAGEIGNMQILPTTAWEILKKMGVNMDNLDIEDVKSMLKDVRFNTKLGWTHLKWLVKRYKGNRFTALRRYNGKITLDETRIYANKISARMSSNRAAYRKGISKLYKAKEKELDRAEN